jgi:PAS domain S-box-containing protein
MKKTKTLRHRLTFAFMGLAVVPLVITGTILAWLNYTTQCQQVLRLEHEHARRISVEVFSYIDGLAKQLQSALNAQDLKNRDYQQQRDFLVTLLAHEKSYCELALLDETGQERIRLQNRGMITSGEIRDRSVTGDFLVPKTLEGTYFGPVRIDDATGVPYMSIAVPLINLREGGVDGVLVAGVHLKRVWELIAGTKLSSGENVYILDTDNRLIAHRNPSVVLRGTDFEAPLTDGFHIGLDGTSVAMAMSRVRFKGQAFTVVAEREIYQAMGPAIRTILIIASVLVLVFLTACIMGILTVRRIIRPIKSLEDVARAIKSGELDRQAPVTGNDEFGELAVAFNTMTAKLRKSLGSLQTEVTERRLAEEELARHRDNLEVSVNERTKELRGSQARFQDIALSSADWIWEMDANGRYTYASGKVKEIFGYEPDEIIGKTPFDLMPKEEGERVEKIFQKITSEKKEIVDLESWNLTKGGKRVCLLTSGVPILGEKGELLGYRGVDKDITERKLAEVELKQAKETAETANIAKGEFLANMSHEIRTPLNGVIGMTGLLLDTELTPEQHQYAETVRVSGESLLGVINDILDFSKIEAGRLDIEILNFDLRTTLENVTDVLAMAAHNKGLEFACLVRNDVPALLRGDPGRLRQILVNLVNNAIKFTEKGEVVVRSTLEQEDDNYATIRFSVTDTGVGIPKDRMDRLFQSFSQVDASTSRRYGGTGLGLAISKELSEMMGGRIGVESEEDKGSTFWFTAVLEKQPQGRYAEIVVPEDIRKMRILVVDDNATNREVLRERLKSWGCRFDEASHGEQALDKLRLAVADGDPFGIAILGMQMPVMNGEAIGRKIKEDSDLKDTILVMLTSLGLRGDAARMKEIGFAAYLTKPVKNSQLYDCLITVMGRKTEEREGASSESIVTRYSIAEDKKRKIRILLAEDNMINQQVALNILEKFGYRADAVANGQEAVKALEMVPYDLVLMDVQMPEMDGLQATAQIRNPKSAVINHDIPVIAMTAHAMKGDRERCLEAGMNDYTTKPIDPKELLKTLTKWIDTGKAGQTAENEPERTGQPSGKEQESPPIDLDKALGRMLGNTALLEKMLHVFLSKMSEQVRELSTALKEGDEETVELNAHTLKGAAANLSADRIAATALRLEQMGRERNLAAGTEALGELHDELARLKAYINRPEWASDVAGYSDKV